MIRLRHGRAAAAIVCAGLGTAGCATAARQITVVAVNPLPEARPAETIEIPWARVAAALGAASPESITVVDGQSGAAIPAQVFAPDPGAGDARLLFQSAFGAGETRRFGVRRAPASAGHRIPPRAYGRFVPERKDDVAWENDRIAYRMYGPALQASGEISSGIDVWVKSVRHLVVDHWYEKGDYHHDHGEGLDTYKVGPSRGCGGLGVLAGDRLYVSSNFRTWRFLAQGPIRVAFELGYDEWGPPGARLRETKRISLDAGQNLNRIEIRLSEPATRPALLAVGIARRPGEGDVARDDRLRWASTWEAPQGSNVQDGQNGQIGCAVLLRTAAARALEADGNLLLAQTQIGREPFVYYAGAAWSKGLDFKSAPDWTHYVAGFARRIDAPVVVSVLDP